MIALRLVIEWLSPASLEVKKVPLLAKRGAAITVTR